MIDDLRTRLSTQVRRPVPTTSALALGLAFVLALLSTLAPVPRRVHADTLCDGPGGDGCAASPDSASLAGPLVGKGRPPPITPEQAIALAVAGEVGENDFRVSDMGSDTTYDAYNPAVAYNSADDEYLVVWEGDDNTDDDLEDNEFEVYGQRIDAATGDEIGGDFRVSDMGPDGDVDYGAFTPAVAYNSAANQYLVVWRGDDNESTGNDEFEIFGQRVQADTGVELGADFRISEMGPAGNTSYGALSPDLAYSAVENEYLVVWSGDTLDDGLVDNQFEIFGQRIDANDGSEIGDDFRISEMGGNAVPEFDAYFPAVAYRSPGNEYLVVWQGDHGNNGGLADDEFEIYGQRIDAATGADLGNDFRLSDMGPDGVAFYDATQAAVAYNGTEDQYLVVWRGDDDSLTSTEYEIFGQLVDAGTGDEIGADFRISEMGPDADIFTDYDAAEPEVIYSSSVNEYLVMWSGDDDRPGLVEDELEIFGQRIDAASGAEIGEDFRISDMGPDGDKFFRARYPAAAYNGAEDQILVVWQGDDDRGGLVEDEFEILGQRLQGASGSEIEGDFQISDMGSDSRYDANSPAVAYNSVNNEYLVVWGGNDNTGMLVLGEDEIFGQRIDASDGAELGGDFRISDMGPDGDPNYEAGDPAVAYNSADNEYLVVWQGDDNTGDLVSGEFEIFGQRIEAATGTEIGGDLRLSDMGPDGDPNYEARNPAVAYNSADNAYLVVWYGEDNMGGLVNNENEIFGQLIDASSGAEMGDDVRLSDMGPDGDPDFAALDPAVAYNSVDNEYLVVWEGDDNTGDLVSTEFEIFGQRIQADTGVEIGADFRVSEMGPDGDPEFDARDPALAYNGNNNEYVVVWEGDDDSGGLVNGEFEIFGKRLDAATGDEIGAHMRFSDMGPDGDVNYHARDPAAAYNSVENEYLVVWEGDDDSGGLVDGEFEIFSQRIDAATGAELGGDLRLSDMGPDGDTAYDARSPAAAFDSADNEYLVVWYGDDDRGALVEGEFEILGQRYAPAPEPTQTTVLSDAPDPSLVGEPFEVDFSVTASDGQPTGSVAVAVSGSLESCTGVISGGVGSCSLALSAAGTYTLTATYAGNGAYASSSASEPHTVVASVQRLYLPVIRRD